MTPTERWWVVGLSMSLFLGARAAVSADDYVAPDGSDAAPGTREKPFATIARAQKAVRELKARHDRKGPIVVELRGGFYELDEPIVFEPADSGTAASPVIYQATPGERPILSGGRKIGGWNVGPDGRWRTTLADVKAGRWAFVQLFVNDQRRFVPRLPKKGYFTAAIFTPRSPSSGTLSCTTAAISSAAAGAPTRKATPRSITTSIGTPTASP